MIDLLRWFVVGDFLAARNYLDAMEQAIPPARQAALDALVQRSEDEDWPEDDYDAEWQGLESVYDLTLPEVLCSSLLIYLHSRVETQLTVVAREVRKAKGLALRLNELSGSPIERTQVYFTKVADIPVASLPQWSTLRDLALLRNALVHRGGAIGSDAQERERLRQLALRYPGLIEVSRGWKAETSELRFGTALCRLFISAAIELFDALVALVPRPKPDA